MSVLCCVQFRLKQTLPLFGILVFFFFYLKKDEKIWSIGLFILLLTENVIYSVSKNILTQILMGVLDLEYVWKQILIG